MQAPGASAPPGFFATRMGVYYPSQHAVLAVQDSQVMRQLHDELGRAGFGADAVYEASSTEMAEFLRRTEQEAGVLAQMVGAELKQTEILLQLAEGGCSFLIVRIDDDAQKEQLVRFGERHPLRKALFYDTLAIEELPIAENAIPGSSPYGINEVPRDGG